MNQYHPIKSILVSSLFIFSYGCVKKSEKSSEIASLQLPPHLQGKKDQSGRAIYEGYGTHFQSFGYPAGGCGVPEELLFDEDGKKLPYIALNVQATSTHASILPRPIKDDGKMGLFANGKNCGRWVKITVGDDCQNGSHRAHFGEVCTKNDGSSGANNYAADELNGKVFYGVVADSCQDPNVWCREDYGHLDISETELLAQLGSWGKDLTSWNNRKVSWHFIDSAPSHYKLGSPKFSWYPGSSLYWPNLIVYNTQTAIDTVEIKEGDTWSALPNNGDMGQNFILPAVDEKGTSVEKGLSFTIRVRDLAKSEWVYEVHFPKSCLETENKKCEGKKALPAVATLISKKMTSDLEEEVPAETTESTEPSSSHPDSSNVETSSPPKLTVPQTSPGPVEKVSDDKPAVSIQEVCPEWMPSQIKYAIDSKSDYSWMKNKPDWYQCLVVVAKEEGIDLNVDPRISSDQDTGPCPEWMPPQIHNAVENHRYGWMESKDEWTACLDKLYPNRDPLR